MNPDAPLPAARPFAGSYDAANSPSPQNPIVPFPPPAIPDHELIRLIGRGSYGQVWLAKNAVGTLRAIKVVYRATFEKEEHFEREFNGLQRFEPISRSHDGFVDILHLGRNDPAGYFYYVMELADGTEMTKSEIRNPKEARNPNSKGAETPEMIRASGFGPPSSLDIRHSEFYTPRTLRDDHKQRGALPLADCLTIGVKLASALEYLHVQGLVHRDIKPSNIIFVQGEPKLADIGLVTDIDEAQSIVGTVGYMPPEGPGAAQADIYSLGKVLYEIAFGKDRQDFPQLPPDLEPRPDHPGLLELNEILLNACATNPQQRYVNAEAMRADLERLREGKSVRRAHQVERRWRVVRRGAGWVAVTAGALALIALAGRMWQSRGNQDVERHSRSGHKSNLSIELGRLDEGNISTNTEANVLYHHAMGIMRGDDYQKLGEAYTNFTEATRLDPNFAKPFAALFEMHVRDGFVGMPSSTPDLMRKLSAKLVELAPALSATHVARACVQYMDWQFDEAKKSWEKAIDLNQNNEFAHTSYGFALTRWGDSSNGLKQLSKAAVLEPSKGMIQQILGDPYFLRREYTNAMLQYRKGLRFTPDNVTAHNRIGRVLQAMHQYLEATDEFEKVALLDGADEAKSKESFDQLRDAFRKNGEKGYWQEQLRRTETKPDSEFYWKAVIHVNLGHTNDVFRWLNKSFETREAKAEGLHHALNDLLFDEYWDDLRADPRFKELVKEFGFPGK